jgi:PPOX class probable F420-dependent enzyme
LEPFKGLNPTLNVELPEAARARLEKARNLWIATVRADGRPHLVPIWFVWDGARLYVCTSPDSIKARNLDRNGRVALALEEGDHPIICEGTARALDQPWPAEVVRLFDAKYDWDISTETTYTLLVEITPRKWLTW